MSSLIDPRRPTPQADQDFTSEPVWLRNPRTGIIFGLTHIDTIRRCQQENYLPSSKEACDAQAREMYEVQGRPWPPVAPATPAPGVADETDAPDAAMTLHERNRRASLARSR